MGPAVVSMSGSSTSGNITINKIHRQYMYITFIDMSGTNQYPIITKSNIAQTANGYLQLQQLTV